MFNPKVLTNLVNEHKDTFTLLANIENTLNNRFADLQNAVNGLCLSAAAGEPFLLIGAPGTGKSRLVRAFCALAGLIDENDPTQNTEDYFEYLLTPFTEPGELFGFYDIEKAMKGGKLERPKNGMMQHARVVYLDEVFNGSSAILNSMLAIMNERMFHDRNQRRKVPLQCLFAATNHIPEAPELRAVFDRFLMRYHVFNAEAKVEKLGQLIGKGWKETYSKRPKEEKYTQLLDRLETFRKRVMEFTTAGYLTPEASHPFYRTLTRQVHFARQYELSDMSNRRMVKLIHLMLIHRIYQAVRNNEDPNNLELGPKQMELLPLFFLDRSDEELVQKMFAAAHGK